MEGRICTNCNIFKTPENFYLGKENKLRSECKECANMKSLERYREKKDSKNVDFIIARLASGLISRVKLFDFYIKNGIKNEIGNHEEIVSFLKGNFYEDIKAILEKGESPSVDRIDPKENYTKSNIQIISLYENQLKGFETSWENNCRKIECIFPNGTKSEFKSIKEAHLITGLDRKTIRDSLNLKRKTRFGYMFLDKESEAK